MANHVRDVLRIYSERIRAAERARLKGWLHGNFHNFDSGYWNANSFGWIYSKDIDLLEVIVWDCGGDPRALREEARRETVAKICEENGL